MSIPFDPHDLDPEEYGETQTTLETDHESAIERVRKVCLDAGFGIPVEFSPSEMLNEKVDADRDPTTSSAPVTRDGRPRARRDRRPDRCPVPV